MLIKTRKIPKKKRDKLKKEAIRLRLVYRLGAYEIARRLNIYKQPVEYWLIPYPLTRKEISENMSLIKQALKIEPTELINTESGSFLWLKCSTCGRWKPYYCFVIRSNRKRGYNYVCKECNGEYREIFNREYTINIKENDWYLCCKCNRWKPQSEFSIENKRNGDWCKDCHKKYYQENRKEILKIAWLWYQENKEQLTTERKRLKIEQPEKYEQKRVNRIKKIKERRKKNPEKYKEKDRRAYAKRKGYGYNELNKKFPGSHGHHINDNDVVYIQAEIHLKFFGGCDVENHRQKVLDFYGSIENMIQGIPQKGFMTEEQLDNF